MRKQTSDLLFGPKQRFHAWPGRAQANGGEKRRWGAGVGVGGARAEAPIHLSHLPVSAGKILRSVQLRTLGKEACE